MWGRPMRTTEGVENRRAQDRARKHALRLLAENHPDEYQRLVEWSLGQQHLHPLHVGRRAGWEHEHEENE